MTEVSVYNVIVGEPVYFHLPGHPRTYGVVSRIYAPTLYEMWVKCPFCMAWTHGPGRGKLCCCHCGSAIDIKLILIDHCGIGDTRARSDWLEPAALSYPLSYALAKWSKELSNG